MASQALSTRALLHRFAVQQHRAQDTRGEARRRRLTGATTLRPETQSDYRKSDCKTRNLACCRDKSQEGPNLNAARDHLKRPGRRKKEIEIEEILFSGECALVAISRAETMRSLLAYLCAASRHKQAGSKIKSNTDHHSIEHPGSIKWASVRVPCDVVDEAPRVGGRVDG